MTVSEAHAQRHEPGSPRPRPVAIILTGVLVLVLAVGVISVSLALAGGDTPDPEAAPTPEADGGRSACTDLVAAGSQLAELGGGALTPLPEGWREEAYRLGNLAAQSSARPVRLAGRELSDAVYLDEAIEPIDVYPLVVVLATACAEAGFVTSADVREAIRSGVG